MTSTINPTYVDLRDDYMTEQEWHEECRKHKNTRKDLVRLWFLNKFGSQTKCAEYLDVSRRTVAREAEQLLAMGELTSEHYQKQMQNSRVKPGQNAPTCGKPAPVFTGFAKDTNRSKIDRPVENSKPKESVNKPHNTHSSTNVQERRSQSRTQPCSLTTTNKSNAITPDVVQSEEQCISVMSTDDTEACSDWERASQLLTDLEGFTHKYFTDHNRIGEEQWEDFAIRCRKLAYFAEMRFTNLRKANEQQAHEIVRTIFPDTAESA